MIPIVSTASPLNSREIYQEVLDIVRHHHERFSGGGYPEGLVGEDIPLGSRLMCVADACDAMISCRPYRSAMHPREVKSQLLANRGGQFDPEIVDLFIAMDEKSCISVPFPARRLKK